MIKYIYTIYDNKLEYFLDPILSNSDKEMIINLKRNLKQIDYHEDKELWELGIFYTTTGEIQPNLKKVINLKDLEENSETKSEN